MNVHSDSVRIEHHENVGVIIVDNPPVNAITPSVRDGIAAAIADLAEDTAIAAVVLHCAGSTFMTGADLKQLGTMPSRFSAAEVIGKLEDMEKPIVAAMHGNVLGGGLEFALGCHYRCAAPATRLGLPEVNLGLIPGAGGTQRLPRLVGTARALEMIALGAAISASEAAEIGLVDRLVDGGDILAGAINYARELIAQHAPPRRTRDGQIVAADEKLFTDARGKLERRRRGEEAPLRAVEAVRAAVTLPFEEGLRREAELFAACLNSAQSRALRYLFVVERKAGKLPEVERAAPQRTVSRVGVIGGGTMGRGISMACANAGLEVTLVETSAAPLEQAQAAIRESYAASVARGRTTVAEMEERLARITGTVDLGRVGDVDLVIEAVFEDMNLKREIFSSLDTVCRKDAILATNTSALDIDIIASATARPEDVIGLHFFSPAHVMRLVEIVRGRATAPEVIATSIEFTRRLRKIGVVAGNCDGFIGNRMLAGYRREAEFLLLEGASPKQVDDALVRFGMSMGPNTMADMAGLDISAASRRRRRLEGRIPDDPRFGTISDRLVEAGRIGQKSGAGFYHYDPGAREPIPDPQVDELIAREAARLGIVRRTIADEDIVRRCILPLINEAARIVEEGVASRPGDVDVVWVNGYGFPRYRGGPMRYADELGLEQVLAALRQLQSQHGAAYWTPAPLIERLVNERRNFSDLG